jgi:molecular chaperone GrpE
MTEQQAASEEQPTGADVESAPEDELIVDAEVVEEEPAQGEPADDGDEVAAELDELAEVQRERDSYLELAQRARADFENYRRRVAGETAEAERRGRAAVAKGILPAVDNLERALAAGESGGDDGLAAGVRLVLDELGGALERAGVHSFDPVGERFDPNLHEAISTAPAEGTEAGTVIETLERGYRIDSSVIRPARVIVSG